MENDELTAKILERKQKSLIPLIEDVAEWLATYLQIPIKSDNFLDVLDNGVILCKLAENLQKHSYDYVNGNIPYSEQSDIKENLKSLPAFNYKCHTSAAQGSFFARENAEAFIRWCKAIGMQDSTLFESEGLVFQKDIKNIVLTLLELGRVAFKYDLHTIPSLIKMEYEIEEEERDQWANVTVRKKKKKKKLKDKDIIDMKVKMFAEQYGVNVQRVTDGKYIVNGKMNIIVRVLRNHFMVRVGGGWDELEHFLSRHNPNKIGKRLISTSTSFEAQVSFEELN